MKFPRVRFFDAVRDCTGGNTKVQRKDYLPVGELPVIDQGQDFIAGYTDKNNQYSGSLPLVLFGDHTRIFKYVDFPFALGADGVKALQPTDGFDAKFLSYYFRSVELPNAGYSRHFKFLKEIDVPKPPLPEQRRIVDLLSRAEGIVRLRREAEKKAAELIPALFLDMFGDPATNPKGWDIKPLHTVAEVGSGNGFPNAYQGKTEGAYPFYKVSDMNTKGNEVEMIAANNYISEDDLVTLRAKAFPSGTVIFPKIGAAIATNKKRVLTCPSCFDNNVMGITPGNGLTPAFLHALMFSKDISDFASDSNPPSMRKTTVEAWKIPVPPLHLQIEFGRQVEAVRSIQSQQSSATIKAQATFGSLMARVFNQ